MAKSVVEKNVFQTGMLGQVRLIYFIKNILLHSENHLSFNFYEFVLMNRPDLEDEILR